MRTNKAQGKELRAARKTKGLTMGDVADSLGVSVGLISNIETGIETPSVLLLDKLRKLYQVESEATPEATPARPLTIQEELAEMGVLPMVYLEVDELSQDLKDWQRRIEEYRTNKGEK